MMAGTLSTINLNIIQNTVLATFQTDVNTFCNANDVTSIQYFFDGTTYTAFINYLP